MNKFAKLFGPDHDQILVLRSQNALNGKPEVRVHFQPENPELDVCSQSVQFADTPAGNVQAKIMFDTLDEARAREFIREARQACES